MKSAIHSLFVFSLTCLIVGASLQSANAQEKFIRVVGDSKITVKPDMAKITAYVIGTGETIEEVIKSYTIGTESVNETFDPMAFKDVNVTVGNPNFSLGGNNPMIAMMGMGGVEAVEVTKYRASCPVTFEIPLQQDFTQEKINSLIDQVVVGIDKAELKWNESGSAGSGQMIVLELRDKQAALDQVAEQAAAEARRKAERLAKLHGKQLGDVISIEETQAPLAASNDNSNNPYAQVIAVYSMMGGVSSPGNPGTIEISSHLEVTYAID